MITRFRVLSVVDYYTSSRGLLVFVCIFAFANATFPLNLPDCFRVSLDALWHQQTVAPN